MSDIRSIIEKIRKLQQQTVATMAVGEAGAKNAAILAAQILALSDKEINNRLNELKKEMALEVEKKADKIK